jgi:hypothetical protein
MAGRIDMIGAAFCKSMLPAAELHDHASPALKA